MIRKYTIFIYNTCIHMYVHIFALNSVRIDEKQQMDSAHSGSPSRLKCLRTLCRTTMRFFVLKYKHVCFDFDATKRIAAYGYFTWKVALMRFGDFLAPRSQGCIDASLMQFLGVDAQQCVVTLAPLMRHNFPHSIPNFNDQQWTYSLILNEFIR